MGRELGAENITKASNMTELGPAPVPGRTSGVDPRDTYVAHGAVCEREGASAGCFLTDGQRARHIQTLQQRVQDAAENYKIALLSARMDELVKKPETDIPWVASLLVDLLAGHLIGKLSDAIVAMKNSARLADAAKAVKQQGIQVSGGELDLFKDFEIAVNVDDPGLRESVRRAALNVDSGTIAAGIKKAGDGAKSVGTQQAKKGLSEPGATKQKFAIDYMDQLLGAASTGFVYLRETVPGYANDAQLVAIRKAMAIENHQADTYKAAIEAKVQRFLKSGVTELGRSYANRNAESIHTATRVVRDTRLVWRQYLSGYPRDLGYESQDGATDPNTIEPGTPQMPSKGPQRFGPRRAITPEAEVGSIVPREFHEAALARHAMLWDEPPRTIVIDDSIYWWDLDRVDKANDFKAKSGNFIMDVMTGKHNPSSGAPPSSPKT